MVLKDSGISMSDNEFFYLASYMDSNLTDKINYNVFLQLII